MSGTDFEYLINRRRINKENNLKDKTTQRKFYNDNFDIAICFEKQTKLTTVAHTKGCILLDCASNGRYRDWRMGVCLRKSWSIDRMGKEMSADRPKGGVYNKTETGFKPPPERKMLMMKVKK